MYTCTSCKIYTRIKKSFPLAGAPQKIFNNFENKVPCWIAANFAKFSFCYLASCSFICRHKNNFADISNLLRPGNTYDTYDILLILIIWFWCQWGHYKVGKLPVWGVANHDINCLIMQNWLVGGNWVMAPW